MTEPDRIAPSRWCASSTPARRRWLFGALYFSEGGPIGFIWWALPTVLAAKGQAIASITAFVSLLVWPWALKFLWAPLVDALRGPRWGHRAWILSAQFVMGLSLLPLLFLLKDKSHAEAADAPVSSAP